MKYHYLINGRIVEERTMNTYAVAVKHGLTCSQVKFLGKVTRTGLQQKFPTVNFATTY